MERLFCNHSVRKSMELEGLWDFWTVDKPGDVRRVIVPSCLENYPGLENYRGESVYETVFKGGGNLHFHFKGVSHTAVVTLDGNWIAGHYNAFTPFEAVVRDVRDGSHRLRIEVDNSFNEESALHIVNDYFTYGGINRPVFVEFIEDMFLERIHITTTKTDGVWKGDVKIRVRNLGKSCPAAVRLALNGKPFGVLEGTVCGGEDSDDRSESAGRGNSGNVTVLEGTFLFESVENYELESPVLYLLGAELMKNDRVVDDLVERIGFREIQIKGTEILFNDKPLHIKGFNRHEDHALYGCAIPVEGMDYDIRLMEDMHANAVRTCHYPNDERFLDLCDEKGILVWEEGHARGLNEAQMRHKNFRSQSLGCIDEMIDCHYNHPSIFTWGILNECASFSEYGREIYEEQFTRIKSLDQSRPVTFASCHYKSDICLDLPDIVSMNIYPGWYHDTPASNYMKEVYDWVQTTEGKGKPYIISEIGAGGIPGYHTPEKSKWSEERQAGILEEQIKAVLEFNNCSGIFLWQFCDCRVPDENFYGRPRCMNNKGIVDEYRRRKLAYGTVKNEFSKKYH